MALTVTDFRAEVRVTQQVGSNLVDMVIFSNTDPSHYYSQTSDKYLGNKPIVKGEFNGTKLAFDTKWYCYITGDTYWYNEVDTATERGWIDPDGEVNILG